MDIGLGWRIPQRLRFHLYSNPHSGLHTILHIPHYSIQTLYYTAPFPDPDFRQWDDYLTYHSLHLPLHLFHSSMYTILNTNEHSTTYAAVRVTQGGIVPTSFALHQSSGRVCTPSCQDLRTKTAQQDPLRCGVHSFDDLQPIPSSNSAIST